MMRIKEEIKRSGVFWLPSAPEGEVPGILSISDGGHAKLELTQPLDTSSIQALLSYNSDNNLSQVLGHIEKDGPVLIDKCSHSSKQVSFTHGRLIVTEVVSAQRVFIGLPHKEGTTLRFNSVSFSIEGIDKWVGISGIEHSHDYDEHTVNISYKLPKDVSIDLWNDMKLQVTFAYTPPGFPSDKKAQITQNTYFKLISQKPCEIDEFISVARKITVFLCFVMNEIVCLDRMLGTSDSQNKQAEVEDTGPIKLSIYSQTWPYSKEIPRINELDMLFKFKDIQSQFERMINKWLDNYEEISPALDLFFLTKTGTLLTWNIQFLTLVQSLEAFHRRTSDEKHMEENDFEEIRKSLINKCPKQERNWFGSKLQYANELTLRNRMQRLTEPFEKYMSGENRLQMID